MKCFAPVILFVYNRPIHTQKTIEHLQKNNFAAEFDLYVFADGAKPNASSDQLELIRQTRIIVSSISGFKSVNLIFAESNKGLANSVIDGVTQVVNKFGRVIVVEDDLETSPYFLQFMNEALDFYDNDKRIFTIGGYNYPLNIPSSYKHDIYVSYRCESWGWATWKDRWNKADWEVTHYNVLKNPTKRNIKKFNRGGDDLYGMLLDRVNGKNDSWAIRWQNCLFENDGLCVSPVKTFVKNIGFDGSGVHCGVSNEKVADLMSDTYNITWIKEISPDSKMISAFAEYFRIPVDPWWVLCIRRIKRLIKLLISR